MSRTDALSPEEWALLASLFRRAKGQITGEVLVAVSQYRRTLIMSLTNVEHMIACELAHANDELPPPEAARIRRP